MEKDIQIETNDFGRYSRITATVAYLPNGNRVKFFVKLRKKDIEGEQVHIQEEYKYNNIDGTDGYTLNLNILNSGWSIGKYDKDGKSSVTLLSDYSPIIRYRLSETLGWYTNSIFKSKDNKLIIQGKWNPVQIAPEEFHYIQFAPIVLIDKDGKYIQGCRVTINDAGNYIDIDINNFLKLYGFLTMDPYIFAMQLINYVNPHKTGIGQRNMNIDYSYEDNRQPKNFFTK